MSELQCTHFGNGCCIDNVSTGLGIALVCRNCLALIPEGGAIDLCTFFVAHCFVSMYSK
jgi:hypothetical protein